MVKKLLLILFLSALAACGGKADNAGATIEAFYGDILAMYQKYPLPENETYPRQNISRQMAADIKKLSCYFLIEGSDPCTAKQSAQCEEWLTEMFAEDEIVSFVIFRCGELPRKKSAYAKVKLQYAYRGRTKKRDLELAKVNNKWKIVFSVAEFGK